MRHLVNLSSLKKHVFKVFYITKMDLHKVPVIYLKIVIKPYL